VLRIEIIAKNLMINPKKGGSPAIDKKLIKNTILVFWGMHRLKISDSFFRLKK
jgi:hypothetical protein